MISPLVMVNGDWLEGGGGGYSHFIINDGGISSLGMVHLILQYTTHFKFL